MNSCFFSPDSGQFSPITKDDCPRSDSQIMIRTARPRDIAALAEVLTVSFHPPQGIISWMHPLLKLGIYEDLRSRFASGSPHNVCLVASLGMKEADEIVGTVEIALRHASIWSNEQEKYPYISNLAVKQTYRRKGVARKLLLKCEQIACNWGHRRLSLHVLENNEAAKHLYLSYGYQVHRLETNFTDWLFQSPKRLLLNKQIS